MLLPAAPTKGTASKRKKPAPKTARRTTKPTPKSGTWDEKSSPRSRVNSTAKPPARARTALKKPVGASFTKGVHSSEFGTRTFKLYIPSRAGLSAGLSEAPLPLVVMLHGCSQTPDDFARGTRMNLLAEEFGFFVVYPAQDRKSQLYRCWNWYKRSDQGRGEGEPALLANLVREIVLKQKVDPARVYVAGLSAGASVALIVADAYPDIFAAVGAHSGLPVGAAHDEATAVVAMQFGAPGRPHSHPLPTISFQGGSDKVVNPRNGRFIVARALEPYPQLHKTVKSGHITDGRDYVRTSHRLGTGRSLIEEWVVVGGAHAWSGGNAADSYTDATGPDASREMVRFFLRHRTTMKRRSTQPEIREVSTSLRGA
ncbi:PHB depolymerase family esterase [Pseudoruegeria sp. SK021]|uniref:extracellular catalytic domain type 1 short-chain-length polyhydroxyalkanoate depolymerase n=1 Tax=Pseudoruegeria sp. SK021 TaxID=1933035 RepID=UPI001F0AF7AA|nr:PHB depolymerase family esterase [Pseudoruegeria sp. SK021]